MDRTRPDNALRARPLDPALLLRYAELAHKTGNQDQLKTALDAAHDILDRASPWELARLANVAERGDDSELEAAALTAIAARDCLLPSLALHLVRKAHTIGQHTLAQALIEALEPRVTESRRREFRAEALLLIEGPIAALAFLRRTGNGPRHVGEATLLSTVLAAAGRTHLARRYLRRCIRHWPDNAQLLGLYIRSCLLSGVPEKGFAWLDAMEKSGTTMALDSLRLNLLIESGEQAAALELAERSEASGTPLIQDMQKLQILLALGHLEAAEAIAAGAARHDWRGGKATAHFSISSNGAKLNELRLYRVARQQGESRKSLVQRFFYPAQQVIESWLASGDRADKVAPHDSGESPIPRRILQYWDKPVVPVEIAAVMESWSAAEGFEYVRLDRAGAITFLQEHFGPDHVRAFRLAKHAAEECDFLRLCWLLIHGGTYADADDLLTGDLGNLLPPGKGMVLYREPHGALQNNFFSTRPGHRLLDFAVEDACLALLRGDNDWTWSKTGPGLITRAAAHFILEQGEEAARRDLLVLPRHVMCAEVHPHMAIPYKKTPAHWMASSKQATGPVLQALNDAVNASQKKPAAA
ncbi:MAG: glycosyltransferase [Xanthomonadales bacterium]|jgi:hypothetical protein|nr:glycosyltransferase [Xanthomonadales bacterium]